MTTNTNCDDAPVDIDAAAATLGVGVRFVRRLCQERRIRYLRFGGNKIRFLPSDLTEFMTASAVEPHASAQRSTVTQSPDSG
jgi:excisionase family DNA binding protein